MSSWGDILLLITLYRRFPAILGVGPKVPGESEAKHMLHVESDATVYFPFVVFVLSILCWTRRLRAGWASLHSAKFTLFTHFISANFNTTQTQTRVTNPH
jgi:hypothetical protein